VRGGGILAPQDIAIDAAIRPIRVIGALGLFLINKNKPKAPITFIARTTGLMAVS
jgi:hypothetical protein